MNPVIYGAGMEETSDYGLNKKAGKKTNSECTPKVWIDVYIRVIEGVA